MAQGVRYLLRKIPRRRKKGGGEVAVAAGHAGTTWHGNSAFARWHIRMIQAHEKLWQELGVSLGYKQMPDTTETYHCPQEPKVSRNCQRHTSGPSPVPAL